MFEHSFFINEHDIKFRIKRSLECDYITSVVETTLCYITCITFIYRKDYFTNAEPKYRIKR